MNLRKRIKEIKNTLKLRTFHLIVTGVSLVLLNTVMFLILSFFFQYFSEQLAAAASRNVGNFGLSQEVYMAIRESANKISLELSLLVIAVLASGMVLNFVFYDVIFVKFIINPLCQIGEKASQMIEDRDRLGEQIGVPMFEEMQKVTRTFNQMSSELEYQMRTLEQKVQERTEELKRAKENIEHLANHDALTGLPNRRLINEHAAQAIKLAHRKKTSFSLLMIDLNQFKKINDTYGHMVGDQVLKQVADRFREGIRESDLISRWGGDEFAIIVFDITNKSDVVKVITKIFNAFDRPIIVEGKEFKIEMCIGAAIYPNDGENQRTLFGNADAALYQAKYRQHARPYCFYRNNLRLNNNTPSNG
jgi:diguanylate cyclase (GGDEF)-like protein